MMADKHEILFFRTLRKSAMVVCKTGVDEKPLGHTRQKAGPQKKSYQPPALLCRQCLAFITRPEDRIPVNGAHHHAFANPHGIVFEIGCFQQAGGCAAAGIPTDEFTWFSGYRWQIALCGGCLTHMGWRFTAEGGSGFYGLILDHLVESAAGFEM